MDFIDDEHLTSQTEEPDEDMLRNQACLQRLIDRADSEGR
jgi:hypothetical protein